MARFGFILNDTVKLVIHLSPGNHVENKWIAALRSDIKFKDASTNYGLSPGDLFIDEKFYRNIDENLIEITKDPAWENPDVVRFAGIIDDEVVGMRITSRQSLGDEGFETFKNTLSSNPLVIEINDSSVDIGWTWDGQNFNPPVE